MNDRDLVRTSAIDYNNVKPKGVIKFVFFNNIEMRVHFNDKKVGFDMAYLNKSRYGNITGAEQVGLAEMEDDDLIALTKTLQLYLGNKLK